MDRSQKESQAKQNRKKKRRLKRKNKRRRQDAIDDEHYDCVSSTSHRPLPFLGDIAEGKPAGEREIASTLRLAANVNDRPEDIKDATLYIDQNFPEGVEDSRDYAGADGRDWANHTADHPNYHSGRDEDDSLDGAGGDDNNMSDAEWEKRESNAEFEAIKEVGRLDRELDLQEEEILWTFMNTGSRIQQSRRKHNTTNNLRDIH
ncbi:hypothetical protein V1506DRAFT_147329 [Lipomyces tetrasporus]